MHMCGLLDQRSRLAVLSLADSAARQPTHKDLFPKESLEGRVVMKKLKQYVNTQYQFDKPVMLGILCAMCGISGIYGFVYEFIFYYFNGGKEYWYWRGGSFGPWIVIYAIGALLIYFAAYRFRKKPWAVFLISGLGCGALEYITGAGIFCLMDGKRNWDYNVEILNFGNLNGFVCLRSVLIFAFSGVLLIYVILPVLFYLANRMKRNVFLLLSFSIGILFLVDIFYNGVLTHIFPNLYSAQDFYSSLGFHFMKF